MKWITREKPQIDRLASPWLIKRFVDPEAVFFYVPAGDVLVESRELKAIPFDVPGVEYTHYNDLCTFDYIIQKHDIRDEAVHTLAPIVRGADTDRHDLSPEAAGLWAVSSGLSHLIRDDLELLEAGLLIYDALYAWAKHYKGVKHTENNSEKLLVDIYRNFIEQGAASQKKTPKWVGELRELLQDQADTILYLNLQQLSEQLSIHPAYLSREFSKHFNDLSFGDYIRKLRIEKAIELFSTGYSLAEISYITGFSDQSHFARIFKKQMGMQPGAYRKLLRKSKMDSKS